MPKNNSSQGFDGVSLTGLIQNSFRMRMTVATVAVLVMVFVVSKPLHGRTERAQRDLVVASEHALAVEEHNSLVNQLLDVESRFLAAGNNDTVTDMFISMVQSEQLELLEIRTDSAQYVDQVQVVRVSLETAGPLKSLGQLLHKLESQTVLIRVESIQIVSRELDAQKNDDQAVGSKQPMMKLDVLMLKEGS